MNAVEIEEAVSKLVEEPFNAAEFPYVFLEAFGNKTATLQRLRNVGKNSTNKTDVTGEGVQSVLQRNNIHMATCFGGGPDAVAELLNRLTDSPATSKHKAKFALATDGHTVHAESLNSDDPPLVCEYKELADHFGYFLELAGISTVRQIRENAFDIKATGRLNRLYIELLRNNPDWDGDQRREELNHFFARLIFCFFAEDTGIFNGSALFTETVRQMSDPSGENTDFVLSEIFRAMDVPMKERDAAKLRSWAGQFPYVNGGLFGSKGSKDARSTVPKFTQIARSYLLHIGTLDWTQINPDIFGSMIQAVADDEERGALGMHYTSVPNILKVLNPLFLDDLHTQLKEADKNPRKLLNLRKRLARIRVFDPACGSGNFLVIAYKEMRKIEAEINILRGEPERASEIPLTNFRGIELRHFAAEIARLALIIAEYQCDELFRGKRLALAEFLPLSQENWITCGNALRLDWQKICPATGTGVKLVEDDLFQTPLDQIEIDFENEGGETYICGNPPFTGTRKQTAQQKEDLRQLFAPHTKQWKNVDYVGAWFLKAALLNRQCPAPFAFVATNSICQGQQVPITWKIILAMGLEIRFAYTSFKWNNLASHNAGVTVVIVGLDVANSNANKRLYREDMEVATTHINPYLTPHEVDIIQASKTPKFLPDSLEYGVYYSKSEGLIATPDEYRAMRANDVPERFFRKFIGSSEFINGKKRYCLWISNQDVEDASQHPDIVRRIESVKQDRLATEDASVSKLASKPHQFREFKGENPCKIFVPLISSESREFFPAGIAASDVIPTNKACYGAKGELWMLSIMVSRLHLAWIATICGRLRTDYSYSNTLGWNTFPIPCLSNENKADLNHRAEEILLTREAHWPATLAELYDPEAMPDDLRAAHDRNDETLERIYIGRRFKNDTERLESLFQMYTEMTRKN